MINVCNKCKHKWHQRSADKPQVCPKCKTYKWRGDYENTNEPEQI